MRVVWRTTARELGDWPPAEVLLRLTPSAELRGATSPSRPPCRRRARRVAVLPVRRAPARVGDRAGSLGGDVGPRHPGERWRSRPRVERPPRGIRRRPSTATYVSAQ